MLGTPPSDPAGLLPAATDTSHPVEPRRAKAWQVWMPPIVRLPTLRSRRVAASRIIWSCLACSAIVAFAVWAGQSANAEGLFLTSLGSSAVIIATAPRSKQSHPARIVLSHGIAMLSGIVLRSLMPQSPLAIALALGIALAIILILDLLHPPALANAVFAFSAQAGTVELLQLTAATGCVLGLSAFTLSRCPTIPD
jgi:CBS-domain-containing membrane protein